MKKIELLLSNQGKRVDVLVEGTKLYSFREVIKNGHTFLEACKTYFRKPLKDGFTITEVVDNTTNCSNNDKGVLVMYALKKLGMQETAIIKKDKNESVFSMSIAREIFESHLSFDLRKKIFLNN